MKSSTITDDHCLCEQLQRQVPLTATAALSQRTKQNSQGTRNQWRRAESQRSTTNMAGKPSKWIHRASIQRVITGHGKCTIQSLHLGIDDTSNARACKEKISSQHSRIHQAHTNQDASNHLNLAHLNLNVFSFAFSVDHTQKIETQTWSDPHHNLHAVKSPIRQSYCPLRTSPHARHGTACRVDSGSEQSSLTLPMEALMMQTLQDMLLYSGRH